MIQSAITDSTLRTILSAVARDFWKKEIDPLSRSTDTLIDILRLFIESIDFSQSTGDGWVSLRFLCFSPGYEDERSANIMRWIILQCSRDIKANFIEEEYIAVLRFLRPRKSDVLNLYLKLRPEKAIDMRFKQNGYSRLLYEVKSAFGLSEFLGLGADLHLLGLDSLCSPYWESPTTLAMYSSQSFAIWRAFLERSKVDIGKFIECELERGPLAELGWTSDALRKLFQWDVEREYDLGHNLDCPDCDEIQYFRVQPYWREQLDKIKKGIYERDLANGRTSAGQASSINIGDLHLKGEDTKNAADSASTNQPVEDGTKELLSEDSPVSGSCEECSYEEYEWVCMDCWLYYERTGHRYRKHTTDEEEEEVVGVSDTVESSEDEFSPFYIHT